MRETHSKMTSFVSMMLVVLTFVSVFSFVFTVDAASNTVAATANGVILRASASISAAKVETLSKNMTLTLLKTSSNGWANVSYNSKKGYVSTAYLTPTSSSSVKMTGKTTEGVNLRKSASTSSESLGLLNKGATVTVLDNSSESWAKVKSGTKTGYVSKSYLTVILTVASTSTAATQESTTKAVQAPTTKAVQAPKQKSTTPTAQPATQKPTTATTKKSETLWLNYASAQVYKGCQYQLIATSNATVKWSSSNTNIATVSDGIVTTKATGTVTITAKTSTKKASCKIKVINGSDVRITTRSASLVAGKTYCLTASKSVSWKSSDTSVATVSGGWVKGLKAGKVVITAYTGSGAASCLFTVSARAPIRFAYVSPNCAVKGGKVNFFAITDNARTAVKFVIQLGSTTKTVKATTKRTELKTVVWKGSSTFSESGIFKVTAYAYRNNKWSTCADAQTTMYVMNTSSKTKTICANRRASDDVIKLIATFEGYLNKVTIDQITGADPTVGYGRVIYPGQQFYNGITKTEAYAYLVHTINTDGYATKVNNFLVTNKIKFNQRHFDALVCFVYNVGTGVLTNDDQIRYALLNCGGSSGTTTAYYINASGVNFRKTASKTGTIIKTLAINTTVTVLGTKGDWTNIKLSDGTKGYVYSEYVSKKTVGKTLDLTNVNRQLLINKICQYHHAAGSCIYGLLYRRVDEMEIFFYGEYTPCYGNYKYNINFTCSKNASFHT